jgi:50S ribosomal subunit-associated GTPase HflX
MRKGANSAEKMVYSNSKKHESGRMMRVRLDLSNDRGHRETQRVRPSRADAFTVTLCGVINAGVAQSGRLAPQSVGPLS